MEDARAPADRAGAVPPARACDRGPGSPAAATLGASLRAGACARTAALASLLFLCAPSVAPGEPADDLWRAADAIDVHAHIGTYKGFDLSLETLRSNLRRYRIRLALVSNIDGAALPRITRDLGELETNQATLAVVSAHPELRGLVWARPGEEGSSPEQVEPFLRDHGFVGVKLHPGMNRFPADAACVDGYLALCAKYDVPAVFHCDQAAPIYRAARRHPKVAVVLYHSGFFSDHEEAIRTVEESVRKGDARLFLETAQVKANAAVAMVRRVGAERVLFGTDATYFGAEHYGAYETLVRALREALAPEDFARVMHGNAERLFRLGR